MKIWLVTTGSSEIQLKPDQYSAWGDWYPTIKPDCYRLPFEPTQTIKNADVPYRIAPRVLGMAYKAYPDEVWDALEFPLLTTLTAKLKDESITQIILLLTDQSQIFNEPQCDDLKCPFWQDTCELQPLLERYFQTHFPNAELVPLLIAPQSGEPGLDDWNFVLDLVRSQLKEKISVDPTSVYVSHQAGTPAISSAVQFCSLAQFVDLVKFVVSNEYNPSLPEKPLEGSSYLRGIRIQEAKVLLNRYDYSGLIALLKPYLDPRKPDEKRIRSLLKAAIQWNLAKFANFRKLLINLHIAVETDFPWYWIGYESGYLAVVRLEQKDVVEALFHSFRASEGLICNWAECKYSSHIEYNSKKAPQLKKTIGQESQELKKYWEETARSNKRWLNNPKNKSESVGLFSANLYKLFQCIYPESMNHHCMEIIWGSAKDERNQQFHRLLGLREKDLYQAWGSKDKETWETMLLCCLNFIAKDDLPKPFQSLEAASLMVKVHQELERAIAAL